MVLVSLCCWSTLHACVGTRWTVDKHWLSVLLHLRDPSVQQMHSLDTLVHHFYHYDKQASLVTILYSSRWWKICHNSLGWLQRIACKSTTKQLYYWLTATQSLVCLFHSDLILSKCFNTSPWQHQLSGRDTRLLWKRSKKFHRTLTNRSTT